eukprot:6520268-Prymnesium_polylepis.1
MLCGSNAAVNPSLPYPLAAARIGHAQPLRSWLLAGFLGLSVHRGGHGRQSSRTHQGSQPGSNTLPTGGEVSYLQVNDSTGGSVASVVDLNPGIRVKIGSSVAKVAVFDRCGNEIKPRRRLDPSDAPQVWSRTNRNACLASGAGFERIERLNPRADRRQEHKHGGKQPQSSSHAALCQLTGPRPE